MDPEQQVMDDQQPTSTGGSQPEQQLMSMEEYKQARDQWKLGYKNLTNTQRSVKEGIRQAQVNNSQAPIFSYDWPVELQNQWKAAYGKEGSFRTTHSMLARIKNKNAKLATAMLETRRTLTVTGQALAQIQETSTPVPTPS
jgi:hypothetical protein